MSNDWFSNFFSDSSIEQGDIIENCHIIIPNEEHYKIIFDNNHNNESLSVIEIDGIVLSQSCDITNDKIDSLIICPIWSLSKFINKGDYYSKTEARESLRQGKYPQYHLLNKFQGDKLAMDYYYVDFHRIYSVPKKFIEAVVKDKSRKRLLPPYREHLSQSFARYFMRVGLPSDIPKDVIANYKK